MNLSKREREERIRNDESNKWRDKTASFRIAQSRSEN